MMLALLVVGAGRLLNPELIYAGTGAVVSIAVDDVDQTVTTDATTVGEVLKRAGIAVGPDDLVEPALNSEILAGSFHINVYRARPVLVVDGENQQVVRSPYRSPKLVAERSAGLNVHPEDRYQVELIRDFINQQSVGVRVRVIRATPVQIAVDGGQLTVRTHADTVGEVLSAKGIVLDSDDRLNVGVGTPVAAGMKIAVTRVGHRVIAVEEPITAPERVIYDDSQPTSYYHVKNAGNHGVKMVTYKVRYHNSREVERTPVQTVVVKEARERVVVRGNRRLTNCDSNDPLECLRACESRGDYGAINYNSVENYYGAYQFSQSTWNGVTLRHGRSDLHGMKPHQAKPSDQDSMARALYHDWGNWGPWPVCGAGLQPL